MVKPLIERFEEKVQADPNSGCWLWAGCVDRRGYGKIGLGGRGSPTLAAHRASWTLHHGAIPDDQFVLHKRDTPACVNPGHLFLGTQQDNVDDMMAKGRNGFRPSLGEQSGMAKLTEEKVRDIKTRRLSSGQFASLYGMGRSAIKSILRGETWRHVK